MLSQDQISPTEASFSPIFDAAQEMKFSMKDFFSKCDQIRSFLQIWPHLLKKSLMENFISCAVLNSNFLIRSP